MKKTLLAMTLLLFSVFGVSTQASAQTLNFTVAPSACQTSVAAPRYYCLGYIFDTNVVAGESLDEWSIYVDQVQPDGTFSAGFLSLYADFDNPETAQPIFFNSTSIQGVEAGGYINGVVSGTLSYGATGTFVGSFTNLKIGSVKRCYTRYNCRMVPAIVSGSISVTATVN